MMSALTQKMSSMKSFKSRTPATKEQIKCAEEELGLTFTKEYSEYLAEFGCASVYGHEFTGICKSARLNVVQVTNELKKINKDIPCDWYVIEEINVDGIAVWQNSKGVVFSMTPNCVAKKIANSFLDYINL